MIIILIATIGAWFLSITYISGAHQGRIKLDGSFWYKHGVPNAFIFSIASNGLLYAFHDAEFSISAFIFTWLTFSFLNLPLGLQVKNHE